MVTAITEAIMFLERSHCEDDISRILLSKFPNYSFKLSDDLIISWSKGKGHGHCEFKHFFTLTQEFVARLWQCMKM